MKEREALKMALEALEIEQAALAYEHGKVEHIENAITAIKEALVQPVRIVLPPITEPTAKSEPVYIMGSYVGTGEVASVTLGGVSFTGNGTAGREADVRPTGFFFQADKRQPEQEPVGEVLDERGGVDWISFVPPAGTQLYTTPPQPKEPEQEPVAYLDEGLGAFYFAKQYKKNVGFTPLYTTPPQREWVGLTDEEVIKQANKEQNPESFARGVLWAEAKLKEKNT